MTITDIEVEEGTYYLKMIRFWKSLYLKVTAYLDGLCILYSMYKRDREQERERNRERKRDKERDREIERKR